MSFSGEPCTHSVGPSRCACIHCIEGYGTDNHDCGNCQACQACLAYLEASAAAFQLAALHDNGLMQDGMNFSPSAPASPHYHLGPSSSTSPPAGPAAVGPGTGSPAFFDANSNAAIPGSANVSPSVPGSPVVINTETLPDGVTVLWWTYNGYSYWCTDQHGNPLGDYNSTTSTSPGGPPHDADGPSQRTVATPASSSVATPSSSLAAIPASSSGLSPASDVSARPYKCVYCDGSAFKLPKDLRRHIKSLHLRDKAWHCICRAKPVYRKDNHRRHVRDCTRRAVYPEYKCACEYACAHKQEYLNHLEVCELDVGTPGRPRIS